MIKPRTRIAGSAVAIVLLVAGISALVALRPRDATVGLPPRSPFVGSIPPPGIRAPNFTLDDYRGATVAMRNLRGRVVVLSFVDSKCTEKCPIVTSVIALAIRRLPPQTRREVVPLLISVSPRVDTPRSVRRFLLARRALSLDYLIGSVYKLRPIWKAYGILPAVDTGNADIHSSDVRIFNREGVWVSTQHAGVDLTPQNLLHDIRQAR